LRGSILEIGTYKKSVLKNQGHDCVNLKNKALLKNAYSYFLNSSMGFHQNTCYGVVRA